MNQYSLVIHEKPSSLHIAHLTEKNKESYIDNVILSKLKNREAGSKVKKSCPQSSLLTSIPKLCRTNLSISRFLIIYAYIIILRTCNIWYRSYTSRILSASPVVSLKTKEVLLTAVLDESSICIGGVNWHTRTIRVGSSTIRVSKGVKWLLLGVHHHHHLLLV